jgi:hypothetical protein
VTLRFLLNEELPPAVAAGARQLGLVVASMHEIGRAGQAVSDEEQLSFAAEQGRVMVTFNRADCQALDAGWRVHDRQHAGILWCSERLIPRRAIGDLVRALQAASEQNPSLESVCLALTRAPQR